MESTKVASGDLCRLGVIERMLHASLGGSLPGGGEGGGGGGARDGGRGRGGRRGRAGLDGFELRPQLFVEVLLLLREPALLLLRRLRLPAGHVPRDPLRGARDDGGGPLGLRGARPLDQRLALDLGQVGGRPKDGERGWWGGI